MNASLTRSVRVLAPNDLRLLRRDWILLVLIFAVPLLSSAIRWLVPFVAELVSQWVDLARSLPVFGAPQLESSVSRGAVRGKVTSAGAAARSLASITSSDSKAHLDGMS